MRIGGRMPRARSRSSSSASAAPSRASASSVRTASGLVSSCCSAMPRLMPSATSRAWAPSWRSRSIRRSSDSWTSTAPARLVSSASIRCWLSRKDDGGMDDRQQRKPEGGPDRPEVPARRRPPRRRRRTRAAPPRSRSGSPAPCCPGVSRATSGRSSTRTIQPGVPTTSASESTGQIGQKYPPVVSAQITISASAMLVAISGAIVSAKRRLALRSAGDLTDGPQLRRDSRRVASRRESHVSGRKRCARMTSAARPTPANWSVSAKRVDVERQKTSLAVGPAVPDRQLSSWSASSAATAGRAPAAS